MGVSRGLFYCIVFVNGGGVLTDLVDLKVRNIFLDSNFLMGITCLVCVVVLIVCNDSLQWRQIEHNGVSNHRRLEGLFHRLFRRGSQKHQNSTSLAFVEGIHQCPMESPHKRPVTRKMFPFDNVIMWSYLSALRGCWDPHRTTIFNPLSRKWYIPFIFIQWKISTKAVRPFLEVK